MSLSVERYVSAEINVDKKWIERLILKLADAFHIRVSWKKEAALLTGTFAVVGGLVGGYAGGRIAAAIGAGVGGAAGFGVYKFVKLREVWKFVKNKLTELTYIVLNYLRRLDPVDYINAANLLWKCIKSRKELVKIILEFITYKLGSKVISSITAA